MYWIREMQSAIGFIEDRLTETLDMEMIAQSANSSATNFQKLFSIATGMTIGEYIRNRRLTQAGKELVETGAKGNRSRTQVWLRNPGKLYEGFCAFPWRQPVRRQTTDAPSPKL